MVRIDSRTPRHFITRQKHSIIPTASFGEPFGVHSKHYEPSYSEMKKILAITGILLMSFYAQAQQILSVHSGYLQNIYNTQRLEDSHLFGNFEYKGGALLGAELKYLDEKGVSNVFAFDYSLSSFAFSSEWELNNKWGNSDLDIHFNQIFLSYFLEYETGRRVKYFLSAGPSLGWLFYNQMKGTIKKYEWYSGTSGLEVDEIIWTGEGYSNDQMSHGVLSLSARTGFTFPINRDMSFKILAGIRADLNNNPKKEFDVTANRAINQLIYLHFNVGFTYNLGNVLVWDSE